MSLGNTPETHDHLITVQKALQLAIFIVNKNFKLNALNLIPSKVTSLFDKTVSTLIFQEKIVSELCKDQNLGATDLYSQKDKAEKIQQKFDAENNAALIGFITVAGLLAGTHYMIVPSIYKDLNLLHKETLTAIQLLREQLSHQKND